VAGVHHFYVEASRVLAGEHQVRMEFAYAGGGLVVFPIVLVYTTAALWVFRGKVGKVAPRYGGTISERWLPHRAAPNSKTKVTALVLRSKQMIQRRSTRRHLAVCPCVEQPESSDWI